MLYHSYRRLFRLVLAIAAIITLSSCDAGNTSVSHSDEFALAITESVSNTSNPSYKFALNDSLDYARELALRALVKPLDSPFDQYLLGENTRLFMASIPQHDKDSIVEYIDILVRDDYRSHSIDQVGSNTKLNFSMEYIYHLIIQDLSQSQSNDYQHDDNISMNTGADIFACKYIPGQGNYCGPGGGGASGPCTGIKTAVVMSYGAMLYSCATAAIPVCVVATGFYVSNYLQMGDCLCSNIDVYGLNGNGSIAFSDCS